MMLETPVTRKEIYLAKASGGYSGKLPEPITREEKYLKKIAENGGGGSADAYTKSETDTLLTAKADKSTTYTKSETDARITEKVAEIVADAPEDFDTLKEMSDWIDSHEDSAAAMNSAIQANATAITEKVDKVSGKGLSTNDYTTEEKTKLASISADVYTKAETDTKLSTKVDKVSGKELSTNDYTTAEKTKLAALENYDDTAVKSQIGELADAGAKNLLKVDKPTATVNGITFTVNDDSSITINGTATGGNATFTITDGWSIPTEVGKKYTASLLSGTADVYMPIYNTSWAGPNVVGSTDFTENSTGGRLARITVKDGTVVDNLTVYPMVCFTEIYQASSAFVPYAPSNYELYKMILALQNGG